GRDRPRIGGWKRFETSADNTLQRQGKPWFSARRSAQIHTRIGWSSAAWRAPIHVAHRPAFAAAGLHAGVTMRPYPVLEPSMAEVFFSPCPRGLENLLVDELGALGARGAQAVHGGVGWQGDWATCQRANLESRLASRVMWRVAQGRYRAEVDIYKLAYSVTWAKWFTADDTIRIYVTAQKSPLQSLEFITLRVKDAVCDHFRTVVGKRP